MEEVGAGYVIFTMMQVTRHMIAPNETYDRIAGHQPGEAWQLVSVAVEIGTTLAAVVRPHPGSASTGSSSLLL